MSSGRLSAKIRLQATELAGLTERLRHEEAYSRLVERRLLEMDPEHPLPVTPGHLGCSRTPTTGAGRGEPPQQREVSIAGGQGSSVRDEDEEEMRRGYEAAHERLRDAAHLIRTLREALARR